MIVFDMAGTTVDEDNIVYKTLRKVINQAGFDFQLEEVIAYGAGKEKFQAIKDITGLKDTNDEKAYLIHQAFKQELKNAYQHLAISAQPGAIELFKTLKENGILVVLNTGFNKDTAEFILNKLDWKNGKEIDFLITASDVKNNRPFPDMILKAMDHFNIMDPKEVVKIGDSKVDIKEGQNAACLLSIGITTGAQSRDEMRKANPDYIIDSLEELFPILQKY